jgi:thioredoxin-related protein
MSLKLRLITCLAALVAGITIHAQDDKKPVAPKPAAEEKAIEEENVVIDGVVPGKFTQDYDAAIAYAEEKKLPIFLVFTGSDWCGWCKIMDKNVFGKPEWSTYATGKLVMVWLDYPKDKSKVPEKYRERNDKLRDKFAVSGYPTYLIQDWDGRTIGKLGSGRDKTPASFSAEVEKLLMNTGANIEKRCEGYKPEDAAKIRLCMQLLRQAQANADTTAEKLAEIRKYAKELEDTTTKQFEDAERAFKDALEQGKVNVMTPEKQAEYSASKAALSAAKKSLEEWLKVNRRKRPTPELNKEYGELNKAIKEAQAKVDNF